MISTLICLATNIYFEARSEPSTASLIAVAEVTLNRVESPYYPDTVCEVVWQDKQFSWTHDGKSDKPYEKEAYNRALLIAKIMLDDRDYRPSVVGKKATHYHATYVRPYWAKGEKPIKRIGKHIFYDLQ